MGQITLYLDEETEAMMKAAVRGSGLSQSKWVANLIREKVAGEWPDSVKALAGAWPDFPTAEDIRASLHDDTSREPL